MQDSVKILYLNENKYYDYFIQSQLQETGIFESIKYWRILNYSFNLKIGRTLEIILFLHCEYIKKSIQYSCFSKKVITNKIQ